MERREERGRERWTERGRQQDGETIDRFDAERERERQRGAGRPAMHHMSKKTNTISAKLLSADSPGLFGTSNNALQNHLMLRLLVFVIGSLSWDC
jgi:hypothetical protein